ncbi:MAG TPA: adenylate/guanylate cyclase domain-containing protein [Thermoleophilaceae bacterium]|nr:adenylate/guanylate cyclase domain-containing protein [Thermoleophilaceae bacterium]
MTGSRKRRLRVLLLLGSGILAALVAGLAGVSGATDQLELDTVDARFEIRGTRSAPDDVVIVAIDDVTFNELNERWPFRRSLHARAVDRLREYDAKVIAYDVQFTEPTEPDEDDALIESLRRSGRAVLSTTEVDDAGRSKVLGGGEAVEYARALDADATLRADEGGVFRSFPYRPQGLRGFAVASAERANGHRVDPGKFEDDAAWIDYAGPPRTVRRISFSRLVRGQVDERSIRGKIAVVGATAPSLQDVHPTPFGGGQLMPGAEIQANAISTVLRGFPLKETPTPVGTLLVGLMAMAAPLTGLRLKPLLNFAFALCLGAGFLVAAVLAFGAGMIVPVVTPLLALAVGAVGTLAVHYSMAVLDREYVRLVFARFVPEGVVDRLVKEADGLHLGGVTYDSTVLFSDIRGFTSYAEGKDPQLVLAVLNAYHSQMCEAILGNGGTLVAYLGDGILAAFGVPLPQDDHAERALEAARQMVGTHLERFNEWMRGQGLGDGFRMGVGLNSGPVTGGNIGSERRLEYTAIGDTVNTASRLEGMTKGTPHQVLVSETTYRRLPSTPEDLVFYKEVEVRGRVAPVKVYGLVESLDEGQAAREAPAFQDASRIEPLRAATAEGDAAR